MTGGVFFTSDLHLGHRLVAELRGFDSLVEHDSTLAARWDSTVQAGDHVWVLGDLTLGPIEAAFTWIDSRPGTKHLVLGNHDEIFPGHSESQRRWATRWDGRHPFASIQTVARRRIAGRGVLLSHFPYPGTSEGTDATGRPFDDRYLQYRLIDLGLPLLHGHIHRPEKATTSERGTTQIHIGLDAWDLCPVPISEVARMLKSA